MSSNQTCGSQRFSGFLPTDLSPYGRIHLDPRVFSWGTYRKMSDWNQLLKWDGFIMHILRD